MAELSNYWNSVLSAFCVPSFADDVVSWVGKVPVMTAPDVILHTGSFTTLDQSNSNPRAVAITRGVFPAVGRREDIMPLAGPSTRIIDLKGRRVLPGLIDNHLHIIRGGLE